MRLIGDFSALLLVFVVVVVGASVWLAKHADRPGPSRADTIVEIAPGDGVRHIALDLEKQGVIDDALLFEIFVLSRGQGGALRAGEYEMPAQVSIRGALALLTEGTAIARRLTVPEGLTSAEVATLLAAEDGLAGTLAETPAEGSLFPETYHYAKGDSRADIVARMRALARETLETLWAERAEDLPFDTPAEALVLASIVEKETGRSGERARVAGVFVNRLRLGMRLQSDPTVIYAVTGGHGPLDRGLTRDDLAFDSPWNTYLHSGLPPGPIANPGKAALEAALHPMETEDLYFVADGSGGHAFARTLEEHRRNVARWREIERERRDG